MGGFADFTYYYCYERNSPGVFTLSGCYLCYILRSNSNPSPSWGEGLGALQRDLCPDWVVVGGGAELMTLETNLAWGVLA